MKMPENPQSGIMKKFPCQHEAQIRALGGGVPGLAGGVAEFVSDRHIPLDACWPEYVVQDVEDRFRLPGRRVDDYMYAFAHYSLLRLQRFSFESVVRT